MGNLTEKHPADPPIKPPKPGRYSRFKQKIRISVNMLRAVYYVGRTGIAHGSTDMRWKTVMALGAIALMEFFYWVMNKRISVFYSVVSDVAKDPNCNFYWFLGQFALAAVCYSIVQLSSIVLSPFLSCIFALD